MVRYVGWGGLPQAFDLNNESWKKEHRELRELLTPDEYAQARRSTQDAHYTSKEVIEGVYEALGRFGVQGYANILEPSAGSGNFIGLLPENIKPDSKPVAVELDQITAAIGSYLYPGVKYLNNGFQEIVLPENKFDLTLGNPPFGNQKIYDPSRPDLDYSIHNYFLAKSIDSLREGGIGAFVVSRYFMDAANNPAREFLAERANLLGAIRLPNTAFKQNALTEVTTDLVFFQKTGSPEPDPAWLKTGVIQDIDGNAITINKYFVDNPHQMIGRMAMTENMFRQSADLLPPADFAGFRAEISKRLELLPRNIYQPRLERAAAVSRIKKEPPENFAHHKNGAFFVTSDKRLARRLPDILNEPQYEPYTPRNDQEARRILGQIQIREALRRQIEVETRPDADDFELASGRRNLNAVYDEFVKKFGFLNSPANKRAMKPDPEAPLLLALEREYDQGLSREAAQKSGRTPRPAAAQKADIFRRRVMGPRRKIEKVETAKEALLVSMNERGRPDLEFMENLSGRPADELTRDLAGLIYLNPLNKSWEMADHYLSGNVKAKLSVAREAARGDHHFQANVEALMAVQPPDLDPVDISVQLGSAWVPPETMRDFARHLFGPEVQTRIDYVPAMGKWLAAVNHRQVDRTVNESTWGTDHYRGSELFEALMANRAIKVEYEAGKDPATGKTIYKVDEAETAAANQKADEIRQAFLDWVWEDQARRERLAAIYNDRFNTHVPPKYDGSHLELPNSSLAIELRPHQKDAIWRGIQEGRLVADHVVGAGKSLLVVGTIMESRRMGLMKKPLVVVPNHLLNQWRDAFYSLYPQANILVADKADFKKENREKLFAKIATGDWDAVVVAHSSFKKIGLPQEAAARILNEQIDDLTEAINEMKAKNNPDSAFSVKAMEKTRERIKEAMKRRAQTGEKDKAVDFGDLGVDALVVDESQEFKNLFISTSLSRVAGLGNLAGSDKAFDLYVKCRYIQEKNDGRGVFFATGTPISNTIAEMYTVQRYLQYDELKAKGLHHFDAWASTFGQVVTGWELDATGVGYKLNSRFAKFQNMPELISMYRSFGDVITKSDLENQEQTRGITPKIKGGKPQNLIVERSELQAEYMGIQTPALDEAGNPIIGDDGVQLREWNEGSIIHRMENPPKDPRLDNPLKITNDARKAGLDFRLIDPDAPDYEASKTNAAADNIFRIWQEWEADRGTQLVFCDLSTPKKAKAEKPAGVKFTVDDEGEEREPLEASMDELLSAGSAFSVYDDLKAKLTARGIPQGEIKFIHEANTDPQKAKLFEDLNQGRVRVLLGSTAKMGAGTNVQKRLVALHHLDAPWRPSDLEQREGRIIRQGNELQARDPENFEVEIIRYATKQTYDARMWQTIENKAAGIEQFRKGDNLARTIEDIAGEAANAAEMKAAATGNELVFYQVQLAADLKKMEAVYSAHLRSRHQIEKNISWLEKAPERAEAETAKWKSEIELRDGNTLKDNAFCFAVNGGIYGEKNRKEVAAILGKTVNAALKTREPQMIGKYRGFEVGVKPSGLGDKLCFALRGAGQPHYPGNLEYSADGEFSFNGFIKRLDNFLDRFEEQVKGVETRLEKSLKELETAKQNRGRPFPQAELLEALRSDNREVIRELQISQKDPGYKSNWKPKSRELAAAQEKEPARAAGLGR